MTNEKNPREFWIHSDVDEWSNRCAASRKPLSNIKKWTHVIEYSAYEQLMADYEKGADLALELARKYSDMTDKFLSMKTESDELKIQFNKFDDMYNGKANRRLVGDILMENDQLKAELSLAKQDCDSWKSSHKITSEAGGKTIEKLCAALTAIKANALSYKPSTADIVDICEGALL